MGTDAERNKESRYFYFNTSWVTPERDSFGRYKHAVLALVEIVLLEETTFL